MGRLTEEDERTIAELAAAQNADDETISKFLAKLAQFTDEQIRGIVCELKSIDEHGRIKREFFVEHGVTMHESVCDVLARPENYSAAVYETAEKMIALVESQIESYVESPLAWAKGGPEPIEVLKARLAAYVAAKSKRLR